MYCPKIMNVLRTSKINDILPATIFNRVVDKRNLYLPVLEQMIHTRLIQMMGLAIRFVDGKNMQTELYYNSVITFFIFFPASKIRLENW